jgi:hypothetical protein
LVSYVRIALIASFFTNGAFSFAEGQSGSDQKTESSSNPFMDTAPLNVKTELGQGDLPPQGSWSMFDYLFTAQVNGKWVYDIPRSYQDVRKRFTDLGIRVNEVLIPMGRSVQRLDTDLVSPRIVMTPESDPASLELNGRLLPAVLGRIFIGFGEKLDQLEIISYNPVAGRFEFQVVEGLLKGTSPTVRYQKREFCMGCHFHGVPMFARNPWLETNAKLASAFGADGSSLTVADRMLAARTEAGISQPDIFHGIPINAATDQSAYAFDARTDRAADIVQANMFYRFACGGNQASQDFAASPVACRSALLRMAVRMVEQRRTGVVNKTLPEYEIIKTFWNKNVPQSFGTHIYYPISDLRVRDPFQDGQGLIRRKDENGKDITEPLPKDKSQVLNAILQQTAIPQSFDPLTANRQKDNPYIHHPMFAGKSQASVYQYPEYKDVADIPRIKKSDDMTALDSFIISFATSLQPYGRQIVKSIPYDQATRKSDFSRIDQLIDEIAQKTFSQNSKGIFSDRAFVESEFIAEVMRMAGNGARPLVDGSVRPTIAIVDLGSSTTSTKLPPPTQEEITALQLLKKNCGACHAGPDYQPRMRYFPEDAAQSSFQFLEDEREQKSEWLKVRRILTRIDSKCKPENVARLMPPGEDNRNAFYNSPMTVDGKQSERDLVVSVLRRRYFKDVDKPCDLTRIKQLSDAMSAQSEAP